MGVTRFNRYLQWDNGNGMMIKMAIISKNSSTAVVSSTDNDSADGLIASLVFLFKLHLNILIFIIGYEEKETINNPPFFGLCRSRSALWDILRESTFRSCFLRPQEFSHASFLSESFSQ